MLKRFILKLFSEGILADGCALQFGMFRVHSRKAQACTQKDISIPEGLQCLEATADLMCYACPGSCQYGWQDVVSPL